MYMECFLYYLIIWIPPVLTINFTETDSLYLLQHNWMLCQKDLTLAKCTLNVINMYPDCWAHRMKKESQGLMFFTPESPVNLVFTDSDYIV